jgi:hypothetical protein
MTEVVVPLEPISPTPDLEHMNKKEEVSETRQQIIPTKTEE